MPRSQHFFSNNEEVQGAEVHTVKANHEINFINHNECTTYNISINNKTKMSYTINVS